MPDPALPIPRATVTPQPRALLRAGGAPAGDWSSAQAWVGALPWGADRRNITVTYGPPRTRTLTTIARTRRLQLELI